MDQNLPNYLQSFVNSLSGGIQAGAPAMVNIPQMNLPTTGDLQKYYSEAFAQLQPYYQAKLQQSKGDLNEAMRQITYDYQTGMRENMQDTELAKQRQGEDLQASMKQLGLTFGQEQSAKTEELNKRGIGLIEDPTTKTASMAPPSQVTYDAQGNPTFSVAGGRAGYERGLLQEDQGLRQEAARRVAQRSLQDIGIGSERKQQQLGETQQRSTFSAARQAQDTMEGLGKEQQQQAYSLAGQRSSYEAQQREAAAAEESARAYKEALSKGFYG